MSQSTLQTGFACQDYFRGRFTTPVLNEILHIEVVDKQGVS